MTTSNTDSTSEVQSIKTFVYQQDNIKKALNLINQLEVKGSTQCKVVSTLYDIITQPIKEDTHTPE